MKTLRSGGIALAVLLGAGAAACSSDSGSDTAASSMTAPEAARTSDAKVAAGLAKINTTAAGITAAASIDKAKAQKLVEEIEPAWAPIEGTIKENSQDTYLAFEDAFAVLGKAADDGDARAAAGAVTDVAKASSGYLKDYPG